MLPQICHAGSIIHRESGTGLDLPQTRVILVQTTVHQHQFGCPVHHCRRKGHRTHRQKYCPAQMDRHPQRVILIQHRQDRSDYPDLEVENRGRLVELSHLQRRLLRRKLRPWTCRRPAPDRRLPVLRPLHYRLLLPALPGRRGLVVHRLRQPVVHHPQADRPG